MLLKNRKVFMVEDNSLNLAVIKTTLEMNGATVAFDRLANNYMAKLRNAMPLDIIILDLMLPNDVSGFDVFTEIRNDPELSHIPVVAVSAADADENIPIAQQLGMAGYIAKPIRFEQFPYQLSRILEGQAIWQDNRFEF